MTKQRSGWRLLAIFLILLVIVLLLRYAGIWPKRTYTAEDFGISVAVSPVDFNQNGLDDYQDILLGARKDAENHPNYDGAYQSAGYPPDSVGVCTDVIWRAFRQAGYSLRAMIDADIAARPQAYPAITTPDSNIDFRRVVNLHSFFASYAIALTTDITDIAQWQPGDIVIFGNDQHIGIISDKRTRRGRAYVIHNGGQPQREEDYFARDAHVTAHYRFDASQLPQQLQIPWEEE